MENSENKEKLNIQVPKSNKNDEFVNEKNSILKWLFIQEIEKQNITKAICKLKIIDKSISTGIGFFCEIRSNEMKILITNNHLINQKFLDKKGKLTYIINNNDEQEEKIINLDLERYTYTNEEYDYTIIEIIDEDNIDYFLTADEDLFSKIGFKNERIFSFEYPKEEKISFSVGKITKIENNYLFYDLGTYYGSSGSPLISLESLKVIGLHKGVTKPNNLKLKKNIGISLKIVFQNIPIKTNLSEKNMIKCEYFIKNEDLNKRVQVYNNQYNIENKIKQVSIYEESEEKPKIIDGIYKFKKQGKYFIKYYFEDTINNLKSMFSNCLSLYKVNSMVFPDNNIIIISDMFNGCKSLKEINFSSFNTNNVTSMSNLFYDCISLKRIKFSKFNTNNVKDMSNIFSNCNSLEEINLSSFNTNYVKDMSNMFANCNSLEEINLSTFNTNNVKDMSNMFANCNSLKEINLSSFNTNNVESMSNMFSRCSSLKEINLSSFNTNNVKNMSNMFSRCSSLKEINLSSFNTNNVKNMSNMFEECNSLKKINVSSFNTNNVVSMSNMFCGCSSLEEIDLSSFKVNNAEIYLMFYGCFSLKKINSNDKSIKEEYKKNK